MKKTLLICVCALCTSLTGFAQNNITLIRDNLCKPRVLPWLVSASLEGAGNQHYVYNQDFYEKAPKHYNDDAVLCMDKTGGGFSEIRISHPDDYVFLNFYEGENDLYGIYSTYERKTKTYTLYVNTIGKEQSNASWDPRKLFAIVSERGDEIYPYVAVSPNGQKAAVSVIQAGRKGKMKGSEVMLLGEGGESLWENSFDPEFTNTTFFLADIKLSNEGAVYIAAVSYNNPTRKTRENETFHLYEITENNVQFIDQKIDFGYICNGKLLLKKDGNIAFGGYFNNNLNEKAQGTYMLLFDNETDNVKNVSFQKFPSNYYEDTKLSLGTLKGSKMSVSVEDLYEFSDGTVAMLGEQREVIQRTVSSGNGMTMTNYTYHAKNILVSFVDENGNLVKFDMINKYQMVGPLGAHFSLRFVRGYGYSFRSFFYNDKIQILYADAMDNYLGKTDVVCKSMAQAKQCSALCTIDKDQQISKSVMIINPKVHKTRMVSPLFIDEDGLLLINAAKKAGQLSKLTYEF